MTNYCEWPDIPEFARPHFPIVPLAMLEKSVDNLAALLAAPVPGSGVTGHESGCRTPSRHTITLRTHDRRAWVAL